MKPAKVPHGPNAERHRRDPLRIEIPQQRAQPISLTSGHDLKHIIHINLGRLGRVCDHIFNAQRCVIIQLVKADLFNRLPEIPGLQRMRQRHQRFHDIPVRLCNPCIRQRLFNISNRGRIIVKPDRDCIPVRLNHLAQGRFGRQLPRCDNHLRVTGLPIRQCRRNHLGQPVCRIFDESNTMPGKEPLGFDRIVQ